MRLLLRTLGAALLATTAMAVPLTFAADHGDAPYASVKRSADLNDLYVFLDPNDNDRVVVILTFTGFTVPSEAVNFTVFDHELVYEFQFDTTFDATPDQRIRLRFSEKRRSGDTPQTATITLPNGRSFTAPTTVSNLSDTPPTPVITRGPDGIRFFAGSCDDPFFFDIPGFNRFIASVVGGDPDPDLLDRGRDSFAGYNTQVAAFSFPKSFFGRLRNNSLGATVAVFNPSAADEEDRQIDRVATPGVNVAFHPLPIDNLQNRSTVVENTRGPVPAALFETLRVLGTNRAGVNLLTDLIVRRGDYVRLDTTIRNRGPDGGNNPGAGFPNGRRLGDDVVDVTLSIVTNGNPETSSDNAGDDTGDRRRNEFPFVAPTIQPFESEDPRNESETDDLTQN